MAPTPPPAGGIGSWAIRYKNIANKHGINCFICNESLSNKRNVFGDKTKKSIFVELKRSLRIWKDLRNLLKQHSDNTIVHCNIPSAPFSILRELISLRITKKRKAKFIVHFHCTVSHSSDSKIGRILLNKIVKRADGVIVLNKESEDYIYKNCKKINNIKIIPNFVNYVEGSDNRVINNDIKNILYVGGVVEEKGCDNIVDVSKYFPDINFKLIGNYSSSIFKKINDESCKNVILMGEQSREVVDKELLSSDLFLFLSRFKHEGFSVALTEAMSAGLPCIVTDWAAAKEQVGEYADYVAVKNPDLVMKVANTINYLKDATIRKKISIYNIKRVKDNYSVDVIMNSYRSFYLEVLNL